MNQPTPLELENQSLRKQLQERDAQHAEATRALVTQYEQSLAELQLEIKKLLERLFGSRSERYIENPDQLKLDFGGNDPQVDDAVEGLKMAVEEAQRSIVVPEHTRQARKRASEKFPAHLPREIVDVDLSDEAKQGLTYLGYDTTETLKASPMKLSVIETRYHKYADPARVEAGVKSPPRAVGLVHGNRYDVSVAAEIIANRYGYHLPFYRQQDQFAGSGWLPSRSTLLNIQTAAADLVHPLAVAMADYLRRDSVIGSDDTGVKLLLPAEIPRADSDDSKSGRVQEVIAAALAANEKFVSAKLWAYRGVSIPVNVFDFTVSRHRDGPDLFLIEAKYQGTLLGDCYRVNTGIALRSADAIKPAACVSHARRHVRDALDNHKVHGKALMHLFGKLYDVEDRGRVMAPPARLELRQSEALSIWNSIREYIDNHTSDLLPKDAMTKAINYLRNQWTALIRYVDDPLIPIDNNEAEQLMKQIAVGRKNWLFVGSVAAGYRSADLMTLVSSAIRNDLDVRQYLHGVLQALLNGETAYEQLMPHRWAESHPDHIRQYRKIERQTRSDDKQFRRAKRRGQKPNQS